MRPWHAALAVLVTLVWGGNYVASKVGMEMFPPLLYSALRFTLVGALLLPFVPKPSRAQMRGVAAIAFTLCICHMALMVVAIHMGLNIAGSAIIAQMGVPFSCLMGAWLFGDKMGAWRLSGVALSFLGMGIIAGNPNVVEHPLAFAIALVAAVSWAISNVQIKRLPGVPVLSLLAWQAVFVVPVLVVLSWMFERSTWPEFAAAPPEAWLAVAFTALGSSIVAYGAWSWLMQRFEVSRVAPYSLLTPVFGIAAGQIWFAESLTQPLIVGGVLTIIGVAIITFRRPKLVKLNRDL